MACGECVIPPLGYPGCYPTAIPTDVGRRRLKRETEQRTALVRI